LGKNQREQQRERAREREKGERARDSTDCILDKIKKV